METLTKKQGEQTLIEEYRGTLANTQTYLDSLGKKLDSLEKGSGLDCQHKLTALAEVIQSLIVKFMITKYASTFYERLSKNPCYIDDKFF